MKLESYGIMVYYPQILSSKLQKFLRLTLLLERKKYDKGYVCVPRQPNQRKCIFSDISPFRAMNKTIFPQIFHTWFDPNLYIFFNSISLF